MTWISYLLRCSCAAAPASTRMSTSASIPARQRTRFEGIDPDVHGTSDAHPADVRLPDIGFNPARCRVVNNEQGRIGGIAPHQAAWLDIALSDNPIDRAAHAGFRQFETRRLNLRLGFFIACVQYFETLLA